MRLFYYDFVLYQFLSITVSFHFIFGEHPEPRSVRTSALRDGMPFRCLILDRSSFSSLRHAGYMRDVAGGIAGRVGFWMLGE